MGRTIPSFRIASVMEKEEWKSFRKALDKDDRKVFDDMFDISILYNSASVYSAKYVRIHPIFMSIIFHHYKQLLRISEELDQMEGKNGSPDNKCKNPDYKDQRTYNREEGECPHIETIGTS